MDQGSFYRVKFYVITKYNVCIVGFSYYFHHHYSRKIIIVTGTPGGQGKVYSSMINISIIQSHINDVDCKWTLTDDSLTSTFIVSKVRTFLAAGLKSELASVPGRRSNFRSSKL